jgi:ABC-type glutathione transport system ATPase component
MTRQPAAARMSLLRVEGLCVETVGRGRRLPLLRDIDLEVRDGQCAALLGESGAGKTMLARAMTGLLPEGCRASAGRVVFRGRPLETAADWRAVRGRGVFYSPQNAAASLNPVLTIGRQIDEVRRIGQEGLFSVLRRMGFSDPRRVLEAYPFMLSGGENQRCLLAMALASRSELLILDEPTAEIDPAAQTGFIGLLRDSQLRQGGAVLLISHQLDMVRELADSIYVICRGAIVDAGTFSGMLAAPRHAYTREIGAYLAGGR